MRIVGEALAALGTRGPAAFAAHLTDDVHYRAIEGAPDDRGPMHGKAAVRDYFQDWLDTFDEMSASVVELIEVGEDTVIALLEVRGRAKLSGIETDVTFAVRYDVRDGKIARGREAATRAELDGPVAEGATGTVRGAGGPASKLRVVEIEPQRRLVTEASERLMRLRFEYELADAEDGRLRITHRVRMTGLATPLMRRTVGPRLERSIPAAMATLVERAG